MAKIIRKKKSQKKSRPKKKVDPCGSKVCHNCGYMPPISQFPKDGRCPKCKGYSWEKLIMPSRDANDSMDQKTMPEYVVEPDDEEI